MTATNYQYQIEDFESESEERQREAHIRGNVLLAILLLNKLRSLMIHSMTAINDTYQIKDSESDAGRQV